GLLQVVATISGPRRVAYLNGRPRRDAGESCACSVNSPSHRGSQWRPSRGLAERANHSRVPEEECRRHASFVSRQGNTGNSSESEGWCWIKQDARCRTLRRAEGGSGEFY